LAKWKSLLDERLERAIACALTPWNQKKACFFGVGCGKHFYQLAMAKRMPSLYSPPTSGRGVGREYDGSSLSWERFDLCKRPLVSASA
jgi:hypothetical protein